MQQDVIQRRSKILEKDKYTTFAQCMNKTSSALHSHYSVAQSAAVIAQMHINWLPVVNDEKKPIGIITALALLEKQLHQDHKPIRLESCMSRDGYVVVHQNDTVLNSDRFPFNYYVVVDDDYRLVGTLARSDIIEKFPDLFHNIYEVGNTSEILAEVMNSAYEGVAVVDKDGIIVQFNEAYAQFIGIDREEALGKYVQDVIENTNLHHTIKTGLPERGVIQYIQGQPMIVHRIPLWKHGKVTGAIGMLIFEGVNELYEIYNRIQKDKYVTGKKESIADNSNKHSDPSVTKLDEIIGDSDSTKITKRMARKVAKTSVTVLITGESGTGKGNYARGIHVLSAYSRGPFVHVNCGAIPANLIESELFGYEEGAFTGARKGGKRGKFELARNGTLFLDEIGELPLAMQTKLLRILEDKEFERVGGTQKYKVNTRVIAATNRNLWQMVQNGAFREDLFYRLNIIEIEIPPLRERRGDIPSLISHFIPVMCEKYQVPEKKLNSEVMSAFIQYPWKGNVRELINIIERLVVLTDGETIKLKHLPRYMQPSDKSNKQANPEQSDERALIESVLNESSGNKTEAARQLGIHRTTLYQKIKKYNIYNDL
ncbi:CBS domain-containing protein [Lentibacillus cibarius]|uniref:CBS domain-containing protein n=1 Tax=Lentibacillus cibarius TaxID=2583219 RepID=A0A549YJH8_9BACI|nr:sigma 54-interacting transcriptional regulator [Lentibacillus cibarius]TRM12046.1 CBS domain-containing protein [Lentibacillus cibarius]